MRDQGSAALRSRGRAEDGAPGWVPWRSAARRLWRSRSCAWRASLLLPQEASRHSRREMFVLFPFQVSSFSSSAPTIQNCVFRPNKRKLLVLTCGREDDIFFSGADGLAWRESCPCGSRAPRVGRAGLSCRSWFGCRDPWSSRRLRLCPEVAAAPAGPGVGLAGGSAPLALRRPQLRVAPVPAACLPAS